MSLSKTKRSELVLEREINITFRVERIHTLQSYFKRPWSQNKPCKKHVKSIPNGWVDRCIHSSSVTSLLSRKQTLRRRLVWITFIRGYSWGQLRWKGREENRNRERSWDGRILNKSFCQLQEVLNLGGPSEFYQVEWEGWALSRWVTEWRLPLERRPILGSWTNKLFSPNCNLNSTQSIFYVPSHKILLQPWAKYKNKNEFVMNSEDQERDL